MTINSPSIYVSHIVTCTMHDPNTKRNTDIKNIKPSTDNLDFQLIINLFGFLKVLRLLACPDSEGETCNGGILVSANDYNRVEAYTTSIQKLLDVYPGMESLVECQTVEDAFSEILQNHCSPLKRYARMVWAALVFLSVVMVALVIVWTIGAHHDQNHHSFGGSVKPHSTTPDMLESGMAKMSNDELKPRVDT